VRVETQRMAGKEAALSSRLFESLRGGRSFPLFPVRRVAGRYEASAFWLRLTGAECRLAFTRCRSPSPRGGGFTADRSLCSEFSPNQSVSK